MAIKTNKTIGDYRCYYKKTTLAYSIASQIAVAGGVCLILVANKILSIDDIALWAIVFIVFALGMGMTVLSLKIASEPVYDILDALSHKAGENTITTPPNPNAKYNSKNGFKTVLQTIYSDSKTPESVLQQSSRPSDLLSQSLNSTSCGVVILGPDKRILSANRAAPIATAQDGEPYLALDFLNEQSLAEWLAEIDESELRAERKWRRVATDPTVFKKNRYFDIVASYSKGAPGETVVMMFDNSTQYLPEEEDLNFISFAAHELRGPITIIRGYLDVLNQELSDRLKNDEPQLMERLTVSANKLSSYINNILNVAKFDRHHLKVYLSEDSISAIYDSIADDMQLRASTQHRLLSVQIPDNLPTVAADRSSISEVISNLVDNAIKYSFDGGSVVITAEQKGDFVEVSVADNGVGMPANVVNNLFHKFYRSHRSREAVAGTGIGLYICRAFVESHGGSIVARSKENEGSVFSFTLPVYATIKDRLLEDGQLNRHLIRQGGGWIKNHTMYRT